MIADRLKKLIEDNPKANGKSMSLQTIAIKAEGRVSPSYLSRILNGVVDNPSDKKLEVIAGVFGVSLDYFREEDTQLDEDLDALKIRMRNLSPDKYEDAQLILQATLKQIEQMRQQDDQDDKEVS